MLIHFEGIAVRTLRSTYPWITFSEEWYALNFLTWGIGYEYWTPSSGVSAIMLYLPRFTGEWHFPDPVSDLRFSVRTSNRFEVTCYSPSGRVAAQAVYEALTNPSIPLPLYEFRSTGDLISRCWFSAEGGMLDDIRFRVIRSELALTCAGDLGSNQVTRGEEVVCSVSAEGQPASDLNILEWSFDGSPRSDGDLTSGEWRGVMARGGVVEVRGRVGTGAPLIGRAVISVVDREWVGRAPSVIVKRVANGQDSRLTLPEIILRAQDLGAAAFYERRSAEDPPPEVTTIIAGGPNDGVAFYTNLTFPVHAYYVINDAAMTRGSGFYNAQERSGGGVRVGGVAWCEPRVVTTVLPELVEAHELRHIDVYRESFTNGLRPRLPDLETRTSVSAADLDALYDETWAMLHFAAERESEAIHQLRGNPNRVTPTSGGHDCALKNEQGQLLRNAEN